MNQSTAIVWFREDLRLQDNPALSYACEHYDRVIPLYLFVPDEAGEWSYGGASQWWLHHALISLDKSLQLHQSRLVIRQGSDSLKMLIKLMEETSASAVFWNRLYTPWAMERDAHIKSVLRDQQLEVKSFKANLLFEPHEIAKDDCDPYRVFTAYWKRCLKEGVYRQPLAVPEKISTPENVSGDSVDTLKLLPDIHWDAGFYDHWQPGESNALIMLDEFIHSRIEEYDEQRDIPSSTGTSRLSPYLHFGEISPAIIVNQALPYRETLKKEAERKSLDRFIAEIGWREFAAYTLYHTPHTTNESMDQRFADFPWQQDDEALRRWQRGQTGFPIIDAGMRELWQTGWMHNRVRMLVASFLTKNLMIHWLEGARWFWDTLVDADLASNTLGWQWVAGCGTDAAPYFRIFNPVLQSQKFDPEGQYIRRWVPELKELDKRLIHEPWKADTKLDYPQPMVDLKFTRERALETFKTLGKK